MRILVVSDTHGHEEDLRQVLEDIGMPDCLIHLGDYESGEARIQEMAKCPLYMVAGNCDFFSRLPLTQIVEIGGLRILITHGHYYFVSVGMRDLIEEAKANGCNVAMFGHTHRPYLDQSDEEVTLLNPGSLSFPRQEDQRPSYAVVTAEEGAPAKYEIRYL